MIDTSSFKAEYPLMRMQPLVGDSQEILEGEMMFALQRDDLPSVAVSLNLRVEIPKDYPKSLPVVFEVGGDIPRTDAFHVNTERDKSLCLGSPLRIKMWANEGKDLLDFTNRFIKPYVYGAILKKEHGVDWVFGELSHGSKGELEDCEELFGVSGKIAVLRCLEAASLKKSVGNKLECLCGCKGLIGRCRCHESVNRVRRSVSGEYLRELIGKVRKVRA